MSKDIPSFGREDQGADAGNFELSSHAFTHGQQMKAVRQAALHISDSHDDRFFITGFDNGILRLIAATTECDVDLGDGKKTVRISIEVNVRKDGIVENNIGIIPGVGTYMDEGALSYRLDMRQGPKIEADFQRLQELSVGDPIVQIMLSDSYETDPQGHTLYLSDNYAQTTITTIAALEVIQNATNLRKPASFIDHSPYITLRELRERQEAASENGGAKFGMIEWVARQ